MNPRDLSDYVFHMGCAMNRAMAIGLGVPQRRIDPPPVREINIGDDEIDALIADGELLEDLKHNRMTLERRDWCDIEEFREAACLALLHERNGAQERRWVMLEDRLRWNAERIIREERVRTEEER